MPAIELPISSDGPLAETLGRFRFDPLAPWGKPGTALAGESGPESSCQHDIKEWPDSALAVRWR